MWQLGLWEMLGIFLITLYFILSLFRRPTTEEQEQENSRSSQTSQVAKLSDKGTDLKGDSQRVISDIKGTEKKGFAAAGIHEKARTKHVLPLSNAADVEFNSNAAFNVESNESNNREYEFDTVPHDDSESSRHVNVEYSRDGSADFDNSQKCLQPPNLSESLTKQTEVEDETVTAQTMTTLESADVVVIPSDEFGEEERQSRNQDEGNLYQKQPDLSVSDNSVMECSENSKGLATEFQNEEHAALVISSFAENLVKDSTSKAAKAVEEIQTHTNEFASVLVNEIVASALEDIKDSEINQESSALLSLESTQDEQLDKFVDEFVNRVIDNAVIDTNKIESFAEDLSEIILTEYTQDVIIEARQNYEANLLNLHDKSNSPCEIADSEVTDLEVQKGSHALGDFVSADNGRETEHATEHSCQDYDRGALEINKDALSEVTELQSPTAVSSVGEKKHDHDITSKDSVVFKGQEDSQTEELAIQKLDNDKVSGNLLENHDTPSITVTSDQHFSEVPSGHDETGPPSPQHEEVKLRNKTVGRAGERGRISWRDSLIIDLEEDPELEDSELSDLGSPEPENVPELPRKTEVIDYDSEESDEFVDSEEDEIIDHDAEAKLGAVGGSHVAPKDFNGNAQLDDDDEYSDDDDDLDDDYDYENDHIFDPQLTVDGLCVSKPKEKGRIKSVDSHYNRAIILDNGCGVTKVGFAGDRVPRVIQPAVVGSPQRFSMHITEGANLKDYKKYGDAAIAKAGVMHLGHPMSAGKVEDWPDVVELWEYLLYNELDIGEGDHPIIVTEIAQNHKKNREKITEILFEQLSVPAMYLADQLALSLYASGMTTGVSLSSGFSCSQAAAIYEGHTLNYTLQTLDIGGQQLTENLKLHLRDVSGHNFTSSSGWQIVNSVKEKMCYLSKDYKSELYKYKTNAAMTKHYQLPDGQVISIGQECISSMEPLFRPDLMMLANNTVAAQPPVHELINRAINRCDPDIRDQVRRHVTISGGTTTAQGFMSRLQTELKNVQPRLKKLRAPEHRKFSSWIGGSILGSLSSFDNQYITVDEYADSGCRIVHRKCF